MLIKIYGVENYVNNKIYIGSTIRLLAHRMSQHKADANRGRKSNLHKLMRELGNDQFFIIMINEFDVQDLEQARAEEQKEIEKYDKNIILNTINAINLNISKREYDKIYRRENLEKRNEYDRNYYHRKKIVNI